MIAHLLQEMNFILYVKTSIEYRKIHKVYLLERTIYCLKNSDS